MLLFDTSAAAGLGPPAEVTGMPWHRNASPKHSKGNAPGDSAGIELAACFGLS